MESRCDQRLVVSGIGAFCAAGPSLEMAWESIVAGESAVGLLEESAAMGLAQPVIAAGRPMGQYGPQGLALAEAIRGSRLLPDLHSAVDLPRQLSERIGFVFGASKGRMGIQKLDDHDDIDEHSMLVADHPLYPWPPTSMGNDLREHLPFRGPATCPVAACASGLVSLIQAARWIQWNECDSVIVGSADFSLTASVISSYRRLGVLSNWKGDPTAACRPFDQKRSGFVIGEGAGVLVMEPEEVARKRGATPLAIWSGHDHRTDPTGLIDSDPDGEVIGVVIKNALANAELVPSDIDAICCHGTGTLVNDKAEAIALRRVFGSALDGIPCFSFKGAIGHTLGASGSVETALCVKALQAQIVPPHRHADDIDPDCPIGPLSPVAEHRSLRHILKLSYGFGGHVAAAVISRYNAQ